MKKMTIILKIKRRSRAQREDKLWNLKKAHPTGEFVNCGKVWQPCVASSLSNVIRQTKIPV